MSSCNFPNTTFRKYNFLPLFSGSCPLNSRPLSPRVLLYNLHGPAFHGCWKPWMDGFFNAVFNYARFVAEEESTGVEVGVEEGGQTRLSGCYVRGSLSVGVTIAR